MIHETYECDRCHAKEPKPEATTKRWECVWREYEVVVPTYPRQAAKSMKVLCCPKCADFMEMFLGRIVSDGSKDAALRELLK